MEAAISLKSESTQTSVDHERRRRAELPAVVPQQVLASLKRGGLYELGESYIRGEWEVADMVGLMRHVFTQSARIPVAYSKFSARFLGFVIADRLRNSQINDGAFEVGRRHYDLGNDLFSEMLDRETMTYTCGYWGSAANLEQAQVAKIDLLCRKLHLKPGMRVLDIGCGWGNFAHYAAKNYGVSVVGLTVSKEQAQLAKQRCVGLDVEIVLQDYRNYSGVFDRVVSIEMIEAVGRKNMAGFFAMVQRCLSSGGLFALQAISAETFSRSSAVTLDQYILWLQKRIFPNGYLPNIRHLTDPVHSGMVIEDVHNFSFDYALTLNEWHKRFEAAWPRLAQAYGEPFRRMWRYYLHGCEALFRERMVQLYQVVYSKGGEQGGYSPVRSIQ
ncbi:MAG: cyclopropane fatty acyl phospholipid synthase [Pseudomonadota bacterium]|jgi:cyclopropane-fatty-acyl-phospholipid synthase